MDECADRVGGHPYDDPAFGEDERLDLDMTLLNAMPEEEIHARS